MNNFTLQLKQNQFVTKPRNVNFIFLTIFFYFYSIAITPINLFLYSKNYYKINQAITVNKNILKNKKIDFISSVSYVNHINFLARIINNDTFQTYITDKKNSIITFKDNTGATNNYSYDAYGNSIKPSNKFNSPSMLVKNDFQYNGERIDNNTNLFYLRARFYNALIQRFITSDDYNFLNKFSFTNCNPVMNIDPTGHAWNLIEINKKMFLLKTKSKIVTYGTFSNSDNKTIINSPAESELYLALDLIQKHAEENHLLQQYLATEIKQDATKFIEKYIAIYNHEFDSGSGEHKIFYSETEGEKTQKFSILSHNSSRYFATLTDKYERIFPGRKKVLLAAFLNELSKQSNWERAPCKIFTFLTYYSPYLGKIRPDLKSQYDLLLSEYNPSQST